MSTEPESTATDYRLAFLEAVLFVSRDPLAPDKLADFLGCADAAEFSQLIEALEERLAHSHRGLQLQRSGGGLQLVTRPDLHDELKSFFAVRAHSRLTIASLETLSIVAYRQPVTIAEISEMRGVNTITPIKNLLQKKMIRITGRKKVPGRPALYSTTREFLKYFGLNDLSELPSLEELTEMFEEKEQPSLFTDSL